MFLAVAGADDKVCGIFSYGLHTVYLMSLCVVGAYLRVSDLEYDSYARPSNTNSCRRGTWSLYYDVALNVNVMPTAYLARACRMARGHTWERIHVLYV